MEKCGKFDFIKIKNTCVLQKTLLKEWKDMPQIERKYLQNTYVIKDWYANYQRILKTTIINNQLLLTTQILKRQKIWRHLTKEDTWMAYKNRHIKSYSTYHCHQENVD